MGLSSPFRSHLLLKEQEFSQRDGEYRSPGGPPVELISFSMYGTEGPTLRFAAVWAERALGTGRDQEVRLVRKSGVDDLIEEYRGRRYLVQMVATVPVGSDVLFGFVFRKRGSTEPDSELDLDVSPGALGTPEPPLISLLQTRRAMNYRLGWASAYPSPADERRPLYAIVWYSQVKRIDAHTGLPSTYGSVPWNVDVNLSGDTLTDRFLAHVDGMSRLQLLVPYCPPGKCFGVPKMPPFDEITGEKETEPRYLAIWYGDSIGGWAELGTTSADTAQFLADHPPTGLEVIRAMVGGTPASPVFILILGERDIPLPKFASVSAVSGQRSPRGRTPLYGAVDDWLMTLAKQNGIRRGQFAFTVNRKLVAARTVTFAEDGYEGGRLTRHRRPFRLASVSKTLTALALLKLYSDGFLSFNHPPALPANDPAFKGNPFEWVTVGSLMGWPGAWDNRSLYELLTHVNVVRFHPKLGLDLGVENLLKVLRLYDPSDTDFVGTWNKQLGVPDTTLPIKQSSFLEPLLREAPLASDGRWAYANGNYHVAGQVVEAITGQSYVEHVQAFAKLLKVDLYVGPSRKGDDFWLGPLYHAGFPGVRRDTTFGTQAVLAEAYAYNSLARTAAGGWAMSAVDLSRLMAALDEPTTASLAPILNDETQRVWLLHDLWRPAVVESAEAGGGLIRPALGWDTYFPLTAQGGAYLSEALTKNGQLPGGIAVIAHRIVDRSTLVATLNGEVIWNASRARSFGLEDVDSLFALIPAPAKGDDLFGLLDPEWK